MTRRHPGRTTLALALALTAAVASALAACGSDSQATGETGGSGSSGDSSGSSALADLESQVDAAIEAASAQQDTAPPSESSPAATDKKILIVPCLAAAEGCSRQADGAKKAADALGWDATVIDGQYDPTKWNAAVKTAISEKYDGVALMVIDSPAIQGSLDEAAAAGIPVVCSSCYDPDGKYAAVVPTGPVFEDQGYLMAQMMYKLTGGELHVLMMDSAEGYPPKLRKDGTMKFIEECKAAGGDCSYSEQSFTVAQLGPDLASATASAIRSNPDTTIVWSPYDAASPFIAQGLKSAGKADLPLVGFDANVQSSDMVRAGDSEVATIGLPLEWLGIATVDDLNSIFNGSEPADSGITSKMLTKDNLPASGAWEGDTDAFAAYLKRWGV